MASHSVSKNKPSKTPRGRPKVSGQALAERQKVVLDAAGNLLAERPSGDITVEQLIQAAGTSRPTFYRWFPDGIDQVFDMLIAQANEDLANRIIVAIAASDDTTQRLKNGIQAYFDWALEHGPLTYGIYREGFDAKTMACRYRQQIIQWMVSLALEKAAEIGLTNISELSVETTICWVECSVATLFQRYPVTEELARQQQELTTDMVLAAVKAIIGDMPSEQS